MVTTITKKINAYGGGDYTTLSSWETARRGNITATGSDTIEIAEIYGGDVGTVNMSASNWTVDVNHYAWIRAAAGEGHEGYFSVGKAYMGGRSDLNVNYTKIGPGISMYGGLVCYVAGSFMTFDGCIIKSTTFLNAYGPIYYSAAVSSTIMNCMLYIIGSDIYSPAIYAPAGSSINVYNCTIVANQNSNCSGISAGGGATINSQNDYFNLPNGKTYVGAATFNKGSNDAASNSDVVTAGLRNIPYSTSNFISVKIGFEDPHLSNGSALRGQGATLANVATDYVGNTRTGYTYDIGAHQRNTSGSDVKTFYESISTVGVGKTYASLSSWAFAKRSNLSAKSHPGYDGYIEVAEIYGGGSVGGVGLANSYWKTDMYNYAHVRAAAGEGHSGYFNTNKAYIGGRLDLDVDYVKIGPGLSVSGDLPCYVAGSFMTFDSCIMRSDVYLNTYGPIFYHAGAPAYGTIVNCVLFFASSGVYAPAIYAPAGHYIDIYNCTILANRNSNSSGISISSATVNSQNNYIDAPSGRSYIGSGTINKGTNDATSSADAVTASLKNIAYSTANFINVTPGSEDFHLTGTSALRTKGADLYSLGVTTDYEGDARHPGYLWDIGADQQSDIPLCWNYTAQYKNSSKLYKASGCGSFPKSLKVPNNVNTNTGKMVDDGMLIDPDRYKAT